MRGRERGGRTASSNAARHAEFDLRPCAGYDHIGRAGFPWEALTHVDALKEAAQQAA